MKRSNFLKSLGTFIITPSIMAELGPVYRTSSQKVVLEWCIPMKQYFIYQKAIDNKPPTSGAIKILKIKNGEGYLKLVVPNDYSIPAEFYATDKNKICNTAKQRI